LFSSLNTLNSQIESIKDPVRGKKESEKILSFCDICLGKVHQVEVSNLVVDPEQTYLYLFNAKSIMIYRIGIQKTGRDFLLSDKPFSYNQRGTIKARLQLSLIIDYEEIVLFNTSKDMSIEFLEEIFEGSFNSSSKRKGEEKGKTMKTYLSSKKKKKNKSRSSSVSSTNSNIKHLSQEVHSLYINNTQRDHITKENSNEVYTEKPILYNKAKEVINDIKFTYHQSIIEHIKSSTINPMNRQTKEEKETYLDCDKGTKSKDIGERNIQIENDDSEEDSYELNIEEEAYMEDYNFFFEPSKPMFTSNLDYILGSFFDVINQKYFLLRIDYTSIRQYLVKKEKLKKNSMNNGMKGKEKSKGSKKDETKTKYLKDVYNTRDFFSILLSSDKKYCYDNLPREYIKLKEGFLLEELLFGENNETKEFSEEDIQLNAFTLQTNLIQTIQKELGNNRIINSKHTNPPLQDNIFDLNQISSYSVVFSGDKILILDINNKELLSSYNIKGKAPNASFQFSIKACFNNSLLISEEKSLLKLIKFCNEFDVLGVAAN